MCFSKAKKFYEKNWNSRLISKIDFFNESNEASLGFESTKWIWNIGTKNGTLPQCG